MNRLLCAFMFVLVLVHSAGAGTFSNPPFISTPLDPAGIVTADFNRDGNLDLVHIDECSPCSMHVLLGNGHGAFASLQDLRVPSGIGGFVGSNINLADVDADGQLDLVIGGAGTPSAQVAVFRGKGDGTFQDAIVSVLVANAGIYPVLAQRLGIGDLNGDGAADIVAPDSANGRLYIAYGDNHGSFTLANSLSGYAVSAFVVDLNNDGRNDFVAVDLLGAQASVFINKGDGTFQTGTRCSTGSSTSDVLLGDVDGDGHPDIVASVYSGDINVFRGNSDGTFAPMSLAAKVDPGSHLVGMGDYNNDGITDLAVQNNTGIGILAGQGNLSYRSVVSTLSSFTDRYRFAQGDFDSDGRLDVALGTAGGIALLGGKGDGRFVTNDFYDVGGTVASAAVADFTGDKVPDIAVVLTDPLTRLLVGTGGGKFTPAAPGARNGAPISSGNAEAGDFNGDGKKDIALATYSSGSIGRASHILFGQGDGTFSQWLDLPTGSTAIADFNHDGLSDTVSSSDIYITVNLGQPTNSLTEVKTQFRNVLGVIAAGDINNDGKPDLVTGGSQVMEIYLGAGDGTLQYQHMMELDSLSAPSDMGRAAITDVNGDGCPDLIFTSSLYVSYMNYIPSLVIAFGNGDATFRPPVSLPLSHKYSKLNVADVNQDGKPDLILNDDNGIAVLLNSGGGEFSQEFHYVAGPRIGDLKIADVNGDGFPDIIAPNPGGSTVAVLLNQPDGTSIEGTDVLGTLTITPEPSDFGVPFTATLQISAATPGAAVPSGDVSFALDGAFAGVVPLASGTASYAFSSAAKGPHAITVTYNGNGTYRSASFAAQHIVNPELFATQTTLTASPDSIFTSQTVRLIAKVTSSAPNLTGVVTFLDGNKSIGAQTLDANRQAQLDTALLAEGSHSLRAKYQGGNSWGSAQIYQPSTSSPVTVSVTSDPTSTRVSSSGTSAVAGTVLTFTADVSSGSGTPFGRVTFYDGTLPLASKSLTEGRATLSTASLGVGTHTISARFTANAAYSASLASPLSISVTGAGATAVPTLTSLAEAFTGELVLTARVSSDHPTIAGTVTFIGDDAVIARVPLVSGQAVLPASLLGPGDHKIRASFSGNAGFAPSVSPAISPSWPTMQPDFLITATSPTPGVVSVAITPVASNFKGTVQLSCGDGLPDGYRCVFTPATLDGGGLSSLQIEPERARSGAVWAQAFAGLGLFGLVCLGSKQRRFPNLVLALALLGVSATVACGFQNGPTDRIAAITVQAKSGSGATIAVHSAQVLVTVR